MTDGGCVVDASAPRDSSIPDAGKDAGQDAGRDAAEPDSGVTALGDLIMASSANWSGWGIEASDIAPDVAFFTPETATIVDTFSDTFGRLGRFTDGTIMAPADGVVDGGTGMVSVTLSASEGVHFVVSNGDAQFPASGTATYSLLAATSPTATDGSLSPGVVTSATATVSSDRSAQVSVAFSMDDGAWGFTATALGQSTPWADNVLWGGGFEAIDVTCPAGACSLDSESLFTMAGANADRLYLVFSIGTAQGPLQRQGAVALQRM
jgi:hypothetical protein